MVYGGQNNELSGYIWSFVRLTLQEPFRQSMTYEDLDSRLVNALLADGRASLRSLAEELDVSVTTVSKHLDDLQETGAIRGFEPRLDYGELGYDVTTVVQIEAEGDALPETAMRLRERPQVLTVYEVTGAYDIIAVAKFRDTDDMNELIKTLLADAAVKSTNTSVVLDAPAEHEQFDLPLEED
jgi:DNA-binding Lrp family transcriptional regulator